MPEGERINVYLPYTLAQRVHEARSAGRKPNLSAGAARGIAEELNRLNGNHAPDGDSHQAGERQLQDQAAEVGGRLDAIEQRLGQIPGQVTATGRDIKRLIVQAAAIVVGVLVLLVAGLAVYLRPLSTV